VLGQSSDGLAFHIIQAVPQAGFPAQVEATAWLPLRVRTLIAIVEAPAGGAPRLGSTQVREKVLRCWLPPSPTSAKRLLIMHGKRPP